MIVCLAGNFDAAHCIKCRAEVPMEQVERSVKAGTVCHCSRCHALVSSAACLQ